MRTFNNNIVLLFGCVVVLCLFMQGCFSAKKMQNQDQGRIQKQDQEMLTREIIQNPSSNSASLLKNDDTYRVTPGDEIEVLVWEHSNFNTTTTVSNTGKIALPLVGEIHVSGMTHSEIKEEIQNRLASYIKGDINITLSIRNTEDMVVSVLGMVSRPDSYNIGSETDILNILSIAGGPTDVADLNNIRIYRKNSNTRYTTIDLTSYLKNGRSNTDALVRPGDVVFIPKQENAIRETSGFLTDIVLLFSIFRVFN